MVSYATATHLQRSCVNYTLIPHHFKYGVYLSLCVLAQLLKSRCAARCKAGCRERDAKRKFSRSVTRRWKAWY